MNQFFSFFIQSNLYISAAASLLYLYYALYLGVNFFLTTPLFVFSGTYLSYHLVRYIPFVQKQFVEDEFKQWYLKYHYFFILSIALNLIILIFTLKDLSNQQIGLMAITFVPVVLYEKILTRKFHLRKIHYLKPFVIALCWSLVCVGLHLQAPLYQYLLSLIECFLFISMLCIAFDLKDKQSDQLQQIITLAHKTSNRNFSLFIIFAFGSYQFIRLKLLDQGTNLPWGAVMEFVVFSLGLKSLNYPILFYVLIDGVIIIRFLSWFMGNPI